MPHYSILDSIDRTLVSEFDAPDSGDVLNVIHRSGCRNADVLRDGDYFMSARLSDSEVWSLYHRRDSQPPEPTAIIPMLQKVA